MGSSDSNLSVGTSKFKPLDPEEFRKQAHQMVDFIADYYKNIETYPVLTQVQPGYLHTRLSETAPYRPEGIDTILKDVQNHIIPGMTHWLSPNFFAFFPATVSTAAFLGEMLCTCFNSVGFNWLASPAATELEMIVMDWLAHMLKLPKTFMFSGTQANGLGLYFNCHPIFSPLFFDSGSSLLVKKKKKEEKFIFFWNAMWFI